MNFLAHAMFADNPDDFLFGSMVSDLFKRSDPTNLPQDIKDGFLAHKYLDDLWDFDLHEGGLAVAKSAIHTVMGHYSNPVFDIACDHVIARNRNWDQLFHTNLDSFVAEVNVLTADRAHYVPEKRGRRERVELMARDNWLGRYAEPEGLTEALTRFLERRGPNELVDSVPRILAIIPEIEPAVLASIPAIRAHMTAFVHTLGYETGMRLQWREDRPSHPEHGGRLTER